MSDDKRDKPGGDKWTQGPELSDDQRRAALDEASSESVAVPPEDVEVLRERQRLMQLEMMDRWVGGVLTEQRRTRRWKLFFRLFFVGLILTSLAVMLYSLFWSGREALPSERHLGVVEVNGIIDSESPASAERIIEGLNRAWGSDNAAAVVLHINSPGGSPVQSQRVYDEIMRLRAEGDKPIYAVVEDIGASGAYYIAAAADEIVVAPASLVGSIGVIFASFGLEEAIERLGIERRIFAAGDNKAFLDPFSAIEPQQGRFWQEVLDATHQQFVDAVRVGRGDRLVDDERIFSGLVWSGEQALELGLVDAIGSLDSLAHQLLEEPQLRDYTPQLDPFERISRHFGRVAAEWLGAPGAQSPLRYQLP